MGLFDELVGGGQQRQDYQDYLSRYDQGAPYDGISDEEAATRYGQVAQEADPDTYRAAARDSFVNMSDEDRQQYASQLHEQAGAQGVQSGWDGRASDPDTLADMTANVHQQAPGLLGSLLGGGAGGAAGGLGGLLGGGAGGGAAGALAGMLGGGGGGGGAGGLAGMLGGGGAGGGAGTNPVMKAALGGIAAMVAKRAMGGSGGL